MKRERILHEMLDYKYCTINNLYSREAKTYKSAVVQLRKDFKALEETGMIERVPTRQGWKIKNKVKGEFWAVTKPGATVIEREDEYKNYRRPTAISKIQHESALRDVLRSFRLLGAKFDLDKEYKGVIPDAVVNWNGEKYFLEIERKEHASMVRSRCIQKYEEMKPKHKVLIVYSDLDWDATLRPQEYGEYQEELNHLREDFQKFLKKHCSDLPNYRYRFLCLPDFHKIDQCVWYLPSGERVEL